MDARLNCGLTPAAQLQILAVIHGSGIVEGCTKHRQPREVRIRHRQGGVAIVVGAVQGWKWFRMDSTLRVVNHKQQPWWAGCRAAAIS
jgi:hypothetical protein